MTFSHENLDVYQLSIDYVAWANRTGMTPSINRHTRDQLIRASQSIPLNIAEGNGKFTEGDRRRYFEIARGSALECAAIQDVLVVCAHLDKAESDKAKASLDRIVAMLTKLGRRGYTAKEETPAYTSGIDCDTDYDSDTDAEQIDCKVNTP